MKKTFTLLLLFRASISFAQLINPADTTGTIITAAIRPNSQQDNIATAYTNELRGTVHHYQTWAELLDMKSSRLVQYQLATVADSAGKVYQYNGTDWAAAFSNADEAFTLSGIQGHLPYYNTATTLGDSPLLTDGTKVGLGSLSSTHAFNISSANNQFSVTNTSGYKSIDVNMDDWAEGSVMLGDIGGHSSGTLLEINTLDAFMRFTGDAFIAPNIVIFNNMAEGHVLTSDAQGKGFWQPPTSDFNTVSASQYTLSSLNTAPASATATGTLGEVRITATGIFVCIATNTWVKADFTTF